jgi:hypothetical protein
VDALCVSQVNGGLICHQQFRVFPALASADFDIDFHEALLVTVLESFGQIRVTSGVRHLGVEAQANGPVRLATGSGICEQNEIRRALALETDVSHKSLAIDSGGRQKITHDHLAIQWLFGQLECRIRQGQTVVKRNSKVLCSSTSKEVPLRFLDNRVSISTPGELDSRVFMPCTALSPDAVDNCT